MQSRELIALEREIGLSDNLHTFMQMAWSVVEPGTHFVDSWSVGCICEHVQAAVEGQIPQLVVNVPPGSSKSRITGCFLPAWQWLRKPDFRWIFAAYGERLVNRDAEDFWKLIVSDWFQARWSDKFQLPTVPKKELIKNKNTGWRFGTTPGGEVTGWHANAQIIDDPIKPEDLTELGLISVREWRARTMSTRWRRAPGQVNTEILIMQRLHTADLSAELIEEGAVHVCIPMEFVPGKAFSSPWGRDPRTAAGELLYPERCNTDQLAVLKKRLGPLQASAQLQQDPVPEGGAVFKKDWLRYWAPESLGLPNTVPLPRNYDMEILSVDCAFKDDEKTNDPVVCQHWGKRSKDFYLLGQVRDWLDFTSTCAAVDKMKAANRRVTKILVEDKANGTAVMNVLSKKYGERTFEKATPKRSKTDRAVAVTPFWDAGCVYLPHPAVPGYEWVAELVKEILQFPRGKHDDQVDAMSQAITYLQEWANYLAAAMAAVRENRGIPGVL
jgi:predicted phage terminase large subunit-like protein